MQDSSCRGQRRDWALAAPIYGKEANETQRGVREAGQGRHRKKRKAKPGKQRKKAERVYSYKPRPQKKEKMPSARGGDRRPKRPPPTGPEMDAVAREVLPPRARRASRPCGGASAASRPSSRVERACRRPRLSRGL